MPSASFPCACCRDFSSNTLLIQRFRRLITAAPITTESSFNRITAHSKSVVAAVADNGGAATEVSELVMVQLPPSATPTQLLRFAVYPTGIVVSVAVQVAPGVAPVAVNTAGVVMDAFCGELVVPEVQVSATSTVAPLAGMKFLLTVMVLPLSELVVVRLPPSATLTQLVWFAV